MTKRKEKEEESVEQVPQDNVAEQPIVEPGTDKPAVLDPVFQLTEVKKYLTDANASRQDERVISAISHIDAAIYKLRDM